MSTRCSIIGEYGVHIYHELADQGFVYVDSLLGNDNSPAYKLCSLEDWYKLVKWIKDNDKDCNGYDILNGQSLSNPESKNE